MKLSNATVYAVAALIRLGAQTADAPLSCRQICGPTDMPDRFVLQILRKLGRAGLVVSTRGVTGGFKLARPLGSISLEAVHDAIEGPSARLPRIAGFSSSSQDLIYGTLQEIADQARQQRAQVTLDALQVTS